MPPINATEEAAIQCAARAGRRYLVTAGSFRRSITSVEHSQESYERALHLIEHRAVVRRITSASAGRTRTIEPLPNPADVDPWAVDLDKIEKDTHVVAECPSCSGSKQMLCTDCGGSTRVRCSGCSGRGRVSGQRGRKNCPDCRAKGDRKCVSCRSGKVDCSTCRATGRVESWLAIQGATLKRVCIHSQTPASEVHADLESPQNFDSGAATWKNELISDSGTVVGVTTALPPTLLPTLDARAERILTSRVQKFTSHVFRIKYKTALSEGILTVSGQPPSLAPSSNVEPLVARRRTILGVSGLLTLSTLATTASYYSRHPWFAQYGNGQLVLILMLLTSLCAAIACAVGLLAPQARSKRLLLFTVLISVLLSAATAAAYHRTGPTSQVAMAALQAGDRDRARITAQALYELGIDRSHGGAILDALHLEDFRAAKTLEEQSRQVHATWYSPENQRVAIQAMQPLILRESERLFTEKSADSFDQLTRQMADLVQPADQERLAWQSALLRADACSDERKGECVAAQLAVAQKHGAPLQVMQQLQRKASAALTRDLSRAVERSESTKSLDSRKLALQDALRLSLQLQPLSVRAPEPTAASITKQLARVDQQLIAAAQKETQRAAHETARRERQRARVDREEHVESGGLRCCDGSVSPSCSCGGSHRGCCSRHGGVCGCE